MVRINETNVVGDGILVHNWGILLQQELGRDVLCTQITKAKTLEDVRLAGGSNVCITLRAQTKLKFEIIGAESFGSWNNHGGNINKLNNGTNNGSGGGRSPGRPRRRPRRSSYRCKTRRDDNNDSRR